MQTPHARSLGGLLLGLAMAGALLAAPSVGAADPLTLSDTHEDPGDLTWDAATETAITLADGASSAGDGVTVEGDVVTIGAAGTYRLSGSLSDGRVVVDTGDEGIVRLVLDGARITSGTTSPLAILDADEVAIVLSDGSANELVDAGTGADESTDDDAPAAALASTADLTIGGSGALAVEGNADDAIASSDGLVIVDGTITVTALDDGIRGKDYLVIHGGTLTVEAGGDALRSDDEEDATRGWVRIDGGTLELTSGADAIDATTAVIVDDGALAIAAGDDGIHSDRRLEIHGGTVAISRSVEGLEATEIVITGGTIDIVASDDGLNVAGGDGAAMPGGGPAKGALVPQGDARQGPTDRARSAGARGGGPGGGVDAAVDGWFVEMSGGTLVLDTGGDGFDSNGSATVTGGTIVIDGPTGAMNGAIDVNGEFLMSDGLLVAAGSARMAETPDAASEAATVAVTFGAAQPAGTLVTVAAADGTPVVSYVSSKAIESLIVSSPGLVAGQPYEVLVGGTAEGERLGGLYLDPTSTAGDRVTTVTAA